MTDKLNIMDVGAHANVARNVQLYVVVKNVLDEVGIVSYRPFGARPNAPRWLQVGARWAF
jgi:Fe(3+) dicitrate transport protein